ncbi:hypothetical protein [Flavobacterium daejeonense]|uniref:hypothetical protein n=1 Tax=Flavobacterium daejeonense TaxID=350893 RepID=UPI00047954ED|nr:hypothetical protein [Flavobacterium daejeonense]
MLIKSTFPKYLIYNSLSEQLTQKQVRDFFEIQNKWQWLGYILLPILLLIKTGLIAYILYIGTFFFSAIPVTFKKLWSIVISAEFVFLLAISISGNHSELIETENFYSEYWNEK